MWSNTVQCSPTGSDVVMSHTICCWWRFMTCVVVWFVSCWGCACRQLSADVLCLLNGNSVHVRVILYNIWMIRYREMVTYAIDIAILPNQYDH